MPDYLRLTVTIVGVLWLLPVTAHQGGWDEFLLVAGPLAIIGGLLWLANKRVTNQLNDKDTMEKKP